MVEYTTTQHGERVRVRWIYDESYQSEGSFALDTEEETQRVVAEECEAICRGDLVPLGAIPEYSCEGCDCPHCTGWHPIKSQFTNGKDGRQFTGPQDLWGIVIEPSEASLKAFAEETFDLDVPSF